VSSRSSLGWLALVLGVLVVGVLVVAPESQSNNALDPTATGPSGAKGVVLLLEELGGDVAVGPSVPASADTALLLDDGFDDDQRDELLGWVRDGGVLVVADPFSPLSDLAAGGTCPDAVDAVEVLQFAPADQGEVRRDPDCFRGTVRSRPQGDGFVVVVGGSTPFVNELLDEDDNAVLAASLLVPTGDEEVVFLHGALGAGDRRLVDLLGPRVAQAIVQAGIALLVYVLWRGRRLGRAVVEPQPVRVAGSELVAAVGRLLGARRRPGDAAATIRLALVRDLGRRTGVAPGGSAEPLVAAVASRTGLDPAWVMAALVTRPVSSDADLVAVTADLDRIRALALEGHEPSGGGPATEPAPEPAPEPEGALP
jgi:hypothetical protein